MLCGPPCLAPVPHLISTSLTVFCFFPSLWLPAFPCPSTPPSQRVPGGGCGARARRQLSLVQTNWGADLTAGTSWERTCCRSWLPMVESSPAGAHHSQRRDPASRHSSPLPPPLLSFPVSCSSPPAFASPTSTHLHVRPLLRAAAVDEAAPQPRVPGCHPSLLQTHPTPGTGADLRRAAPLENPTREPKASSLDLLNVN